MINKIQRIKQEILLFVEAFDMLQVVSQRSDTIVEASQMYDMLTNTLRSGKTGVSTIYNFAVQGKKSKDMVLQTVCEGIEKKILKNELKNNILYVIEKLVNTPASFQIAYNKILFEKLYDLYYTESIETVEKNIAMGALNGYEKLQDIRNIVLQCRSKHIKENLKSDKFTKYSPISYGAKQSDKFIVNIGKQFFEASKEGYIPYNGTLKQDKIDVFRALSNGFYKPLENTLSFNTIVGEIRLYLDESSKKYNKLYIAKETVETEVSNVKYIDMIKVASMYAIGAQRYDNNAPLIVKENISDLYILDNVHVVENARNGVKGAFIVNENSCMVLPFNSVVYTNNVKRFDTVEESVNYFKTVTDGFDCMSIVESIAKKEKQLLTEKLKKQFQISALNEDIDNVISQVEALTKRYENDKKTLNELYEMRSNLQAMKNVSQKF